MATNIIDNKIDEAIKKLKLSENVLVYKKKDKSLEKLAKYTESTNTAIVDLSVNELIEKKFISKYNIKQYPCLISYGMYIYDDTNLKNNIKKRNIVMIDFLAKKIKKMVKKEKLFIFIKGTPEHPECQFTRKLIKLLDDISFVNGRHYNYFNIYTDPILRDKMKLINNWPTYPQIYIKETFMGGLDIFKNLLKNRIFNEMIKD